MTRAAILLAALVGFSGCDARPLHLEEQGLLGGNSRSATAYCESPYRLRVDAIGATAAIQCEPADGGAKQPVAELHAAIDVLERRIDSHVALLDKTIARLTETIAELERDGGTK